jgi:phosphoglycerol transferase
MTPAARERLVAFAWAFALVALVAWGWLVGTGRAGSLADATVMTVYAGDAWSVLGQVKAYQDGDALPFVRKAIAALGAPYGAHWTDYPTEDLVYFAGGVLARVFGIEAAGALLPLLSAMLAALSFFVVARALGGSRPIAFVFAALFALAPFAFARNLLHVTLTVYWHLPLALFAVRWAARPEGEPTLPWHRAIAIAGALAAGLLNPYYTAGFLWLLGFVLVGNAWARRGRGTLEAALLMALAIGAFLLTSLDSIWIRLAHGGNPEAIVRAFAHLDVYGMRLPDLAAPTVHRWETFQALANQYHAHAPNGGGARGEAMLSYLGVIGCVSLFLLVATSCVQFAARQHERLSPWFWMAAATLAFAVVGGINYFLGALGFVMLRASNRFSIVLLAIALLWACERLSRGRRGMQWAAAVLLLAIGLFDQLPKAGAFPPAGQVRAATAADRKFVEALEAAVPPRSMVFQLPVKGFPETGSLNGMQDYEHFRPYFFSKELRFSYGTMKGRGDADWQWELGAMEPEVLAPRLAELGFAAIVVNFNGYPDLGAQLRPKMEAALGPPLSANGALVAYRVPAAAAPPRLPVVFPALRFEGFAGAEPSGAGQSRWALRQQAAILARRPYTALATPPRTDVVLDFALDGNHGALTVLLDGAPAASIPANTPQRVSLRLPAAQDRWKVEIRSDQPPRAAGGGDPRLIAFRLSELRWREAGAAAAK